MVAYLLAKIIENTDIKNPERSENICAASVIIAKDPANIPPTTSATIKEKQTILTVNNFFIIFDVWSTLGI